MADSAHLVIVDDEPDIRQLVQSYLSRHGFAVSGAESADALRALMATAAAGRAALSRVTAPTLVINSREDNRIPPVLAERVLDELRAAPVERHWVDGCGHVITVDYCRETVADLTLAFLARHVGS